jgi:2-iminoacetate synthase ThiH
VQSANIILLTTSPIGLNWHNNGGSMTLKEYRKLKKLSLAAMAEFLSKKLGRKIYGSHIQSWESGCMPSITTANEITKATNGKVKDWE